MDIVLAHSHARTLGGGERAVLELALAWRDTHEVELLLGGFAPAQTYAGLAALPYRTVARGTWPVRHVTADAIVTNSFGANLLALRNGPRVAYWVHSTRSRFLQPGARRADLLARRAVDWLAVRRARLLIANSQYTARRLWQLYRRDADAVVYPGVDATEFEPEGAPAPGNQAPYAITVGRLSPEKGLDRLLALWRDLPDLPLQVVGDGDPAQVRRWRSLAPSGVTFRGPLTGAALRAAYQGATVAVFTPYGEEFGLAPIEAMASGVPVVAWRDGALPETVLDGQTGFLVDDAVTFRQRVRLLVHDAPRRAQLGEAARARALTFSWARTAAHLAQVLRSPAPRPQAESRA
jgi:glycosyltransferase involved in cell wall biosynthesis